MAQTQVQIVEVALRDGLQNEKRIVSTDLRVEFAERLVRAGVRRLELGAFVRSDRVPQMAGSGEIVSRVMRDVGPAKSKGFSALVPNLKGLEEALKTRIPEIAIFTAATEGFARANINCSIEESFRRFEPVVDRCKREKIRIRAYLSVCFGCPYQGTVSEAVVVKLAERLHKLGCFEISIGDTIGVATPGQVVSLLRKLKRRVPLKKVAGHFHDTRGTALANIFAAFQVGIRTFDSSLGGLGGCPYAPGASGNVATEDVIYMFDGMKVKTALNLKDLIETNQWFTQASGILLPAKVGRAGLLKELHGS